MAYGCVYGNVNFSFFLGFRAQKGKTDPINALSIAVAGKVILIMFSVKLYLLVT